MNTKKFFETPVLDVICFTVEDIMGVSGGTGEGGVELPDHDWE